MVRSTFAERVLQFYDKLSKISFEFPDKYSIVNPYKGDREEIIKTITTAFYQKYYNDNASRRLILGSSPALRGTVATGIPFEDASNIKTELGIDIGKFYIKKSSSWFLHNVISKYGGRDRFFSSFFMSFVCPLCVLKINSLGNKVNCNYYENKLLKNYFYKFIIDTLFDYINLGIDTTVCYCIGSGENYTFLTKLNTNYRFFNSIVPLEHPRFIMQYNLKRKFFFIDKYIDALCLTQ
jgi:hypothetical protein